jgi:hypothetical protein
MVPPQAAGRRADARMIGFLGMADVLLGGGQTGTLEPAATRPGEAAPGRSTRSAESGPDSGTTWMVDTDREA